eukprot:GHRQ01032906.1.p1 GENE.GHRQ01032906.1~~GHRQ01032906.1.p1  ORF type:complete len:207 (+),score=97.48 GHRQ01032906.1:89-622(+)
MPPSTAEAGGARGLSSGSDGSSKEQGKLAVGGAAGSYASSSAAAAAGAGSAASLQGGAEQGESFYFRVNGVPLFAKGANLIPLHVLSTAVGDEQVVRLLQSAAAANMNMVRIWGGGLYQVRQQGVTAAATLHHETDELRLLQLYIIQPSFKNSLSMWRCWFKWLQVEYGVCFQSRAA